MKKIKGDTWIAAYLIICLLTFGVAFNRVPSSKAADYEFRAISTGLFCGFFWPLYLPVVIFEKK